MNPRKFRLRSTLYRLDSSTSIIIVGLRVEAKNVTKTTEDKRFSKRNMSAGGEIRVHNIAVERVVSEPFPMGRKST